MNEKESVARRISRREFMKLTRPENVIIDDGLLAQHPKDVEEVDGVLAR